MASNLIKKATNPSQYDSLSWEYDGLANSPRTQIFTTHILRDRSIFKDKDVLDIGSGTGWLLEAVHNAGARSALGIEPSKKNVELAKKHHPEFETICTSLEEFSTQQKFDIIISVQVMVHIADVPEAMQKIANLLREGGQFLLIVPDVEYARTPRYDYEMNIEDINPGEYIVSTKRPNGVITDIIRKPEVYEKSAKAAGLRLLKQEDIFPLESFLKQKKGGEKFSGAPIAVLMHFQKAK